MSAPRTLDAAEALLDALFEDGYPALTRDLMVRALDAHARNETARLRAAGEALAVELRTCLVRPRPEGLRRHDCEAALAAWDGALGVEVAR